MTSVTKEMTIDELRELLEPAENLDRITIDPRMDTQFRMDEGRIRFQTNNQDFGLTSDSYVHLGQMLGIPGSYIQKAPHNIMVPHMNYWLANKGLAQISFAAEDGIIKLFSKGALNPVSNELILNAVQEEAGSNLQVHHASHSLSSTNFSIVNGEFEQAVAVGDAVRTGVSIENSYDLSHPLTVAAYVHRLACTNGAISSDNVFRFTRRGGGNDGHEDWISDAIHQAFQAADQEVQRLRDMREVKLDGHMSDALASIYQEFGVPASVRKDITNRVIDEEVDNLYDLYNTVTWIASNHEDVLEDSALSRRLMTIGGRMASHPEICGECFRVKN